jgi:hypothetical protein
MTDLSPITQTVWNAAWTNCPVQCGDIKGTRRSQIAAALQAVADQWKNEIQKQSKTEFISGVQNCIDALNEIASELKIDYNMDEYSEGPLSEFNDGGMPLG